MQRLCDIEATVARCSFPEWVITVKKDDKRPYLQVGAYSAVCNVSGHPLPWSDHKWFLSYHMTTSEIVQTAFKAVMTAVEHEVREQFMYRDQTVFAPHWDVEWLASMLNQRPSLAEDAREEVA